jgi:hypothetical protein
MRRKYFVLALLLGFVPWIIGCDETLKGNDSKKAEEKAKAENLTSSDPVKKSKPAAGPLDFPATDPLITAAAQSRHQVAQQEEALLDRLDEIRTLLGSAKADPARLRESVDEFLALVKEIRRVVVKAGEGLSFLDDTATGLARSMKHLGSSYRTAAGLFREKAGDYSEMKLRDQLNAFADDFDSIAKEVPDRVKSIQAFRDALPKLKAKVREANAFLDDVILFLSSHPGAGADPRERYSAQFEAFVSTFSELIRTLDEFRGVFRERAISKVIQDGNRKEALAQRKLEEARREELARAEENERTRVAAAERTEGIKLARFSKGAEGQSETIPVSTRDPAVPNANALQSPPVRLVVQNGPSVSELSRTTHPVKVPPLRIPTATNPKSKAPTPFPGSAKVVRLPITMPSGPVRVSAQPQWVIVSSPTPCTCQPIVRFSR